MKLQLRQHTGKEKEGNVQQIFYLDVGLVCRVEDYEQEGPLPSSYLGISQAASFMAFVWNYIILKFSQKVKGLLRV